MPRATATRSGVPSPDDRSKAKWSALPLRLGKAVEGGIGRALEEVAEAEKRERALALRRSTDEDAIGATPRGVDDRAPDRRLADSGLALEDERGGAVRDVVEEAVCACHLPLPSDELHGSRPFSGASSVRV